MIKELVYEGLEYLILKQCGSEASIFMRLVKAHFSKPFPASDDFLMMREILSYLRFVLLSEIHNYKACRKTAAPSSKAASDLRAKRRKIMVAAKSVQELKRYYLQKSGVKKTIIKSAKQLSDGNFRKTA